eukprot:1426015-Lingulodinium_polyedra.AAC.1
MERGNGDDKCSCAVVASRGARICQRPRKPCVDDDKVASHVAGGLGVGVDWQYDKNIRSPWRSA